MDNSPAGEPPLDWYSTFHDGYLISLIAQTRCEKAVLQQVCFWYPKAKSKRDGYLWMIKPALEFQEAGLDYALDTIQRAIRALAKSGVLVTQKHFHPYRSGLGPVYWIRPGVPVVDDTRLKTLEPVQSKSYLP